MTAPEPRADRYSALIAGLTAPPDVPFPTVPTRRYALLLDTVYGAEVKFFPAPDSAAGFIDGMSSGDRSWYVPDRLIDLDTGTEYRQTNPTVFIAVTDA